MTMTKTTSDISKVVTLIAEYAAMSSDVEAYDIFKFQAKLSAALTATTAAERYEALRRLAYQARTLRNCRRYMEDAQAAADGTKNAARRVERYEAAFDALDDMADDAWTAWMTSDEPPRDAHMRNARAIISRHII